MRISILFLFIAVCQLFALDNSVRIYETSGSTQNNRVVSVSRLFAKGEITGCVQAFVNGVAAPTQTDVKSHWDDKSLKHAIVSFQIGSLNSKGQVVTDFRKAADCNNSGYQSYSAILSGINWGAEVETTSGGISQVRNAKTMLAACGEISLDPFSSKCRYWLHGPLVSQIIVEDRSPARASDFGYQYLTDHWAAATDEKYKSLHPIFVVTFYTPSSGGSYVEVQTILENVWADRLQQQEYSFVIRTGSPLSDAYTRTKPYIHTQRGRWRISRWSGPQPGSLFIDYNLPYLISARAVPQWDLKSPLSGTAADTDLKDYDSRVGSEEPALCEFGTTFCGDWVKAMGGTGGRGDISLFPHWYALYLNAMGNSNFSVSKREEIYQKLLIGNGNALGSAGQHWRENLEDRCFDARGATKLFSSAGCKVNAFGKVLSVSARPTGRTWHTEESSGDDRLPAVVCSSGPCQAETNSGWQTTSDTARAHQFEPAYTPYLITGDWYFLEELQYWAAAQSMNPPVTGSIFYGRHGSWGFLNFVDNERWWPIREVAHAAYISPDDDPAKEYFTEQLENNMAILEGFYDIQDGKFYDPKSSSRWYWGRNTVGSGNPNPMGLDNRRTGSYVTEQGIRRDKTGVAERRYYLGYRAVVYGWLGEILPEIVSPVAEFFQKNLLRWTLNRDGSINDLAWLNAMYTWPMRPKGTTWDKAIWFQSPEEIFDAIVLDCTLSADLTASAKTLTCRTPLSVGALLRDTGSSSTFLLDSEKIQVNPFGVSSTTVGTDYEYKFSIVQRGILGTSAAAHAAGTLMHRVFVYFDPSTDTQGGYPIVYRAGLSFLAGKTLDGRSGRKAWDWYEQIKGIGTKTPSPQWTFIPRDTIGAVAMNAGADAAVVKFTPSTSADQCTAHVTTSSQALSSLDDSDTAIPLTSGSVEWVASGLPSATDETVRITCGTARVSIPFTTTTRGETVAYVKNFGPAPTGGVHLLLEVSSSSDMRDARTASASCPFGCTVTVDGLSAEEIYYERYTWTSEGGDIVARSPASAFIARDETHRRLRGQTQWLSYSFLALITAGLVGFVVQRSTRQRPSANSLT